MINLLPPTTKKQLYAARSNTLLARYNLMLLGALGFLMLIIGFTYIQLSNAKNANAETVSSNNKRVTGFASIQDQAQKLRKNLATDKVILDMSTDYTKLILAISGLMPDGTTLNNLSLDAATFGAPTQITVNAVGYDTALTLKNNFSQSPLFSNVHFINITRGTDSRYPLSVALGLTIKKGSL